MRKYMKIGIGLAVAAVLGGSAYYYKSTQNTIADTDATEEVEKIKKAWPQPKISVIHATRGRPQIAWQRRQQWLMMAKNPMEIEWLFCVDHDDPIDYTHTTIPKLKLPASQGGVLVWVS